MFGHSLKKIRFFLKGKIYTYRRKSLINGCAKFGQWRKDETKENIINQLK